MLGARHYSLISLFAIAAAAPRLDAQGIVRAGDARPALQMTPAQRTFANSYLSAITGPDIERYKRLIHPRSRACMNAENADFFNRIFERRVRRVAKNPRMSIERVKDRSMFSPAKSNGLHYPSRPSHVIHINLVSTGSKQYQVSAFVVRENGIWYEVLPCPSAKSLSTMREAQRRDAEENLKARAAADSLQEPLRTELFNLLQAEGPVSATRRYVEATQVDLTFARRVVKALEKDLTLIH
ncbi:MAG TPA: hypothetical protein VFS56_05530 [Gemmatimonadaceae bacterium]|nr:hypothetical protein [Gemmatimonadaceae bacterium]